MKVLVLACLVAVASALPRTFLGAEKCTWGPAYWCKNYKQATECNAIAHCKAHVWKSNDLCGDCRSVVQEVHDYTKNNGTQVLALMNELCLKLGSIADECNVVVQIYGETIVTTIVEMTVDSTKRCQELDLCPNSKQEIKHRIFKVFLKQLQASPKIIHLKSVKADYCEDCKIVFNEIKFLLKDKVIQGYIIALLEKLCEEFGSIDTECKSLVDQYAPIIFDVLSSLVDADFICSDLGLCNSTKKVFVATPFKSVKLAKMFFPMAPGPVLIDVLPVQKAKKIKSSKVSVECAVCEFAMNELDSILGDNATKVEIEEALDEVCSLLPSTIRSECQNIVKEYAPVIVELLLKELQPDKICRELGLCSGAKKLVRVSLHQDFKENNDEPCELCTFVVQFILDALKTNATEEEIKKLLEDVCNFLPEELKTECNAIVKEYGTLIIKLILGDLSPQEVCQALTLCPAGEKSFLKNKCFLGKSYWCANYHNALKCQAMAHCNFIA